MHRALTNTLLAALLLTGTVSTQEVDRVRTPTAEIEILPLAHGTVAIVHGSHVILVDPARFVPGQPAVPQADLQELAKAYFAKFGTPPPPTPDNEEPAAELLVSAVPVRPDQLTKFRGRAGLRPRDAPRCSGGGADGQWRPYGIW